MSHPVGEPKREGLRVDFDRRLKLEFHGSKITSDAGLLAYRELDDALGPTEVGGGIFHDSRTGKNGWHPGESYPRVSYIVTNLSRPAGGAATGVQFLRIWTSSGEGRLTKAAGLQVTGP